MKKSVNVVGAAIVRDATVLSAQRAEGMSLGGYWEFPGGKIESDETPQEALVRELNEELECPAAIGNKITSTTHEYDSVIVTLTTYFAQLLGPEPTLTEHAEIRWLGADELDSVEWAPADIPAVEIVRQHLQSMA